MDEYDKKFAEMQKYIPFLEAMIERLQKVKDKSREAQLQKMQSLHGILSNSKRKLRIETLQRCEDVLQKLHNKVEKGNTAGINPSHKKSGENSSQTSSSKETRNTESPVKPQEEMMDNETPASPSPTASPDHMPKSTPIIIPMERKDEANSCECDSKPASPDQCEQIPVTAPIIIPTEREDDSKNDQSSTNHNSNNCGSDSNDLFSEWEMLEESENQINKSRRSTWQSVIAPGTDVATAAKLVCNNLPQKVVPEGRSHIPMAPRHIPTVPAPSLGGSRRIMSVFDKNRLGGVNASSILSETRPESPLNVPEVRLKSPDPDILFPRLKITSPRQKDCVNLPKLSPKPSTPLLVSPPSVLTEPPLSIEDLAELLSDEADGTKTDKQNKDSAAKEEQSKLIKEVGGEDMGKSKKETLAGKNQQKNCKDSNESKVPTSFVLTQEDIDRESERRWEEIDKHIVKLTARRCLPSKHSISPLSVRLESSKTSDTKVAPSPPRISQPLLSPGLLGVEKPADHRNRPPSPLQNIIKEKENEKEHRYADNYERHPRQFRDAHDSGDDTKDKNTVSSNLSRITDDQLSNMGYSNLRNNSDVGTKSDESTRNVPLYQRRSQPNSAADGASPLARSDEYRRESADYFARKAAAKTKRPPLLPSPIIPDFPNSQWGSTPSYSGNIRPPAPPAPNTYQRNSNNTNFHQDMWQMGPPACAPVDFHQMNEAESRIPQFNPHPPIRPIINSAPRPQDINRGMNSESGFREEAAGPTTLIQPLLSPPSFPPGTQYRNPRIENRSYDASYDRSSDISQTRHTWDSASTRVSDVGYRRDSDSTRGRASTDGPVCRPGTPAPYARPGTPAPLWSRDRERGEKDWNRRGRGRERYYNDRGRSESRAPFVRDSRRSEWERDVPNERDNRVRLSRDARVSERDPRVRPDQRSQSPSQPKETVTTATVRDPRLNKDTLNVVEKPKDTVVLSSDRDPRRRSCEVKATRKPSPTGIQTKTKDKTKTQKSIDQKNRRDSEFEDAMNDRMSKDKLHSPLESLYGVIDTKAKTGQGYGLQKFKIPKIKRPDPPPPPPPPPKAETVIPESKIPETTFSIPDQLPETSWQNVRQENNESDHSKRKIDEEIRKTDDTSMLPVDSSKSEQLNDALHEVDNNVSTMPKVASQTSDGIPGEVSISTEALPKQSGEQTCDGELSKVPDTSKPKEEVTKEWIEALIRKSFEFGQGKQLFDRVKLLQKLGEAIHVKKLKKIKKIIESDSESSSSSKEEEIIEPRKTHNKKKRRVIFSDSSEEESLADRLGLLKDSTDEQNVINETPEEINKMSECTIKSTSQNEDHNTPEAVSKIDNKEELANPDKDGETHDTSAAVEEAAIPIVKKKRSYRKRGKGAKKVDANVEEPANSKVAESDVSKDEPKSGETEEIEKKPPQKIKHKRRNSLEMLQEDIREMFISEGVVTATGHRMCRLIKEGHSKLNSTVQNLSNSTGGRAEKNARKSADSDSDVTNSVEHSKKDDSILLTRTRARTSKVSQAEDAVDEHIKTPKRTSRRVSKVISRQYVDSSDSEENEPLIKSLTRSESLKSLCDLEATTVAEQSENLQKSETSHSSETPKSEESQAVMFLRRSKRVPRVLVEKTEITKLDSSKMMFDSSSDESFGIDVSELAAAVDISLHPEPQSHPDPGTAESPKASRRQTRPRTTGKKKKISRKNKSAKIIDDKADDTMSFTDEGSMLSDISMSSSITSIKKNTRNSISRNSIKSQQDTNEELLSNILIGLTAKSTPEKSNDEIDKESDVDADEELDENVCETSEGIKKGVTKRKKKKFNWQLGILSKKKRKKKASAHISPVLPVSEFEFADPSECSNKTTATDNDNARESNSFESLNDSETLSQLKNRSSGDPNQLPKLNSSQDCSSLDILDPVKGKSSAKRIGKNALIQDEAKPDMEQGDSEDSVNSRTGSVAQVDTYHDMNCSEVKKLLEYAWTGQERYKCMLCPFTGKNIVHHYKLNHPEDEVLISRLVPADAKLAIDEASNINIGKKSGDGEKFEFNCRFCTFSTSETKETAKEAFYEHCTTHTGEYRFKCVSCPYQTVAKSSLKSHYYKVCRKFAENVSVAIIEDNIPDEDSVHGYICSICHFVQLKKCNIENHLVSKHPKNPDAKYIQINMSLSVNDGSNTASQANVTNQNDSVDISNSSASGKNQEISTQKSDHSDEVIEIIPNKDIEEVQIKDHEDTKEEGTRRMDIKTEGLQETNFAESSSHLPKDLEKEASADQEEMETDSSAETMRASSQQESEVAPVNGNLSVFVCPPEVAIKEHEIQLERKKKMQEIVENIGIKVNKDGTKPPLSIIDKLKVKMDTNSRIDNDQNIAENKVENVVVELLGKTHSTPVVNSRHLDSGGNLSDEELSQSSTDAKSSDQVSIQPGTSSNLLSDCPETPSSEDNMDKSSSNLETKIKDPLTTFDDTFPNFGSDTETSDTEMMSSYQPYESDSSNEPSENQISPDVNSLLKESTADDNKPAAKGLMLFTIQRLAAQLQNAKTGANNQSLDDAQVKVEKTDEKLIPKAPDVVPLSSVKQLWNKQEPKSEEVKYEKSDVASPPKNLIRIRRLSGDKLSVPSNPVEMQEENQLSSTEGSASDLGTGVLQTDTEEECSFLRIENVVSLAPTADDAEGESSIISDIRKAVETSPIKPRISILKKSPIILHKVGNRSVLNQRLLSNMTNTGESVKIIPLKSLPSTSQSPKQVLANIVPMQSTSKIQVATNLKKPAFIPTIPKTGAASTLGTQIQPTGNITLPVKSNFKIIKLTRTATLLKHKECIAQSVAMKLKSTEAYKLMLRPAKLCHLFKCMSRDCTYTTNSLEYFKNHYEEHVAVGIKEKLNRPFGCQNCAYCCAVLEDWNLMEKHLMNRHSHCRYQCSYCFYRAVTQSYVELHQAISHPGHLIAVLEGKSMGDNIPDDCIERSEIVKPFICQQECGKSFYIPETFMTHLKTKHGPLLSMFKCHLCPATCLKPEQLISHYKMHGIYKYQCMYCLNGSDVSWELHNHLSNFHCNLPPYVIERTLLPQASISKDVIDQLVIKNVEDEFKYTDLVTNVEEIPEENWQLANNLTPNDSLNSLEISIDKPQTEILLNDKDRGGKISLLKKNLYSRFCETNEAGSNSTGTAAAQITIQHSKDDEGLNNRISIPEVDDFDEYPLQLNIDMLPDDKLPLNKLPDTRSSQDSLENGSENRLSFEYPPTNSIGNVRTAKNPQKLVQPSDFGETLFVINNDVDPLSLPETSDSSNQFVTNSGRGNSESLRHLVKKELPVSKETTLKKAEDYDDSDIEILEEDIEIVKKPINKETKINQEVVTATEIEKNNPINSDKAEESPAPVVDSQADDSNVNTESNTNIEASTEIIQPLTLDDIKDTGFTGNDLYKCGNEDCSFSSATVELLKSHLMSCTAFNEGNSLSCAHCTKRFVKVGFLLEHLKTHGLKRFGCSLCDMRCTLPHQAMSHMKSKHKFGSNKLVPADPKNPSTDGLFIVQPIRGAAEKGRGKKRSPAKAADKDTDKSIDVEKLSFNPDEIDTLPRQAIYNREALCAVCPYTTKVRTNMVRHLQLHAKDATVPESGPVNPVPCLDKKERMFDKMVNLASSSHQNGRMGGKSRETSKENPDDASLPKFVPEHKRYVCGVAECNYLTVDDTMLRCHLKALHSDEPYFRCPHCPLPQPGQETQNIGIDKMGIHLKMHDSRLYKCSHCNHHHYHRHVVERHLSDKHAEKRPFVKVIREPEATETAQTAVQDEVEDEGPDRDGNHWKCNICDYKCIYKNEMISHASTEHDERSQFKCTECSYKTTGKINVEQHFVSRHPTEPQIKYDMVYQKIKGGVRKAGEPIDHGTIDEPFDTTPLWRRDMPRVRHIRGILLEEEEAAAANESPTKGTKRKSEGGDIANRPVKSRPGRSTSGDVQKLSDEKIKVVTPRTPDVKKGAEPNSPVNERVSKTRAVDKLRLLDKSENDKLNESLENPVTDTSFSEDFSELSDSDMGQFGPYGKPNGSMYVCTLCSYFETRYKHDLRDHLYRELKYKKWHCRACGFLSVNKHTLVKHFGKQHPGEQPDHEMLTPDNSIEEWVTTLLQRQTNIIKGISNKSSPRTNADKTTASGNAQVPPQSKRAVREINSIVQSPVKTTEDNSKTVDLTHAISNLKDSSIDIDMDLDVDDEDSRDNDDLVIDLKDDHLEENDVLDEKAVIDKPQGKKELEKLLTCKHCNMKFARWRGFKLHVQVTHLKRLGFLCPYCDRSANSELTMRQHIRAKHPGLIEKIVHNPAAGGPELTSEFWEKEYGLICPNKRIAKKRKRKQSADELNKSKDDVEKNSSNYVCNTCGFSALNLTGLKAHMRIHTNKNTMKCAYCTFTGSIEAEISQHWKVNHPHFTFKVEDLSTAGPSSLSPALRQQKKSSVEEYSDDIEEEQVPSATNAVEKLVYCCFYCSLRSSSLETVRTHWEMVHREPKGPEEPVKWRTGLPFRYKQMSVPLPSSQKILQCGYCEKKAGKATLRVHLRRKHSEVPPLFLEVPEVVPEGWTCQWCNEFCETENIMNHHQNMFHSHLPSRFKKQESVEQQKGYSCPECSFHSTSIVLMRKHVTKHVNLFKCKYCDTTFTTPSLVASHSTQIHPGSELKIESISNYDSLVEKMMAKVLWGSSKQLIKTETLTEETQVTSPSKRQAVAKKSTAKQSPRILPSSSKVRCVARKSTNSLSRYPPGLRFRTDEQCAETSFPSRDASPSRSVEGFSYYGVPSAPINLASLSTYMSVSGHQMKVNCTTLGQLMNINPRVLLKDLKQDVKSSSVFFN